MSPKEPPSAVMSSRERANPGVVRLAGRRRNMPSKSTIAALPAFHGALQPARSFGSDCIRTEAPGCSFDAFSSREPASTSLENAPIRAGIMKERTPLAQPDAPIRSRHPPRRPARRYRLAPQASTASPAGIKQVIDIFPVYLRIGRAIDPAAAFALSRPAGGGWRRRRARRRRRSREHRTALAAGGLKQALHPSVVGFDPRYAGGHVHQEPVAAQHVLAPGQNHAAQHGDEI